MWFHSQNGLFFERGPDGDVTITKTDGKRPEEGGKVIFRQQLDAATWVSAVLTMTLFSERSGDHDIFMDHHHGHKDMLDYEGRFGQPERGVEEEV